MKKYPELEQLKAQLIDVVKREFHDEKSVHIRVFREENLTLCEVWK